MAVSPMEQQLTGFSGWTRRHCKILDQLASWLQQQDLYSLEIHQAIRRARTALYDDTVTVAVIGECSRGKTELINALFFGNLGYRLLPTDAGRTTMCPTEILQDPEREPCLRLLPIETRAQDVSLSQLRRRPEVWTTIPLSLDDPQALAEELLALTATRTAHREEAIALGLYESAADDTSTTDDETVIIPRWRLAQLNIRHPLFAKGLRVIDTPGLNAVGNEPELTNEILERVHAVLFVLSADTGVTRSELAIWQQLVAPGGRRRKGTMVVLNKIDTLWDDLRPREQIEQRILEQCADVASMLDIPREQVFSVSAQKALLARVRGDSALEHRSGVVRLEDHLSNTVVEKRRDLIMADSTTRVQNAIASLENIIEGRYKRTRRQIHRLREAGNRGDEAVARMLRQTQREKKRYRSSVEAYRESRQTFLAHGQALLATLDLQALERMIEEACLEMSCAWTTPGLKEAMRNLFDDIAGRIEAVREQARAMRRLTRTTYRRLQTDHGFSAAQPAMLCLVKQQVALEMLYQEAEIVRKSSRTILTEQHFVVKRYCRTIVERGRQILHEVHREAREWIDHALDPLTLEIKEHRDALSRQIRDLKHAGQSRKTIQQRIGLMKRDAQRLQIQLGSLRNVRQALSNPIIPNAQGQVRPTVVDGGGRRSAL